MPGITVQINIDQLKSKLDQIGEKLKPEGLLNAIGLAQLEWIDENFETEGGKVGGWAPLKPNTIASRRKNSSAILQNTGRLRESFVHEVKGNKVVVSTGNKVEYASFHEEGTAGPYEIMARGRALAFMTTEGMVHVKKVMHPGLPQRRMLPNKEEVVELAEELIRARVKEIDNAGR